MVKTKKPFARLNTLIHQEQKDYIDAYAKDNGISQGEAVRELLGPLEVLKNKKK